MDKLAVWSLALLCVIDALLAAQTELTIEVAAGKEECFFMTAKPTEYLDIEYQVIDGGQGDIDINFRLEAPGGSILLSEFKKSDSSHRVPVSVAGDYKVCWDNTISSYNTKLVFFDVGVERADGGQVWDEIDHQFGAETDVYDMKIQDIQDAMGRVRNQLLQSRRNQDQLRVFEARDRSIAETNYELVMNWSVVQLVVMLVVGVIQVIMVRSLFDDRSAFSKVWKTKVLS